MAIKMMIWKSIFQRLNVYVHEINVIAVPYVSAAESRLKKLDV